MIKPKSELLSYINKHALSLSRKRKGLNKLYERIKERFEVPEGEIVDIVNGNVNEESANEFYLFTIAYCLKGYPGYVDPKTFFTEPEFNSYSRRKYKEPKLEYPIRIKCIQVADDQWIGKTNVNFLMNLNRFQMINYNINAQRTMRRVVNGDNISYKIFVNNVAVKKIQNSFHNKAYIPDTITLGITSEADPEFYYDEETCELVIDKINYFDIPDGYHRYLAMIRERDEDKSFDYPLELRVVYFDENKTKQFIFQQDQKTKMKKIDSDSMDMNSMSNIITDKLNTNCYLAGNINRNDGIINYSVLSSVINFYYFKGQNINKKEQMKIVMNVSTELKTGINMIIDKCPSLLDKKFWGNQDIMFTVYAIKTGIYQELSEEDIKNIYQKLDEEDIRNQFKYFVPTKKFNTIIENIVENK